MLFILIIINCLCEFNGKFWIILNLLLLVRFGLSFFIKKVNLIIIINIKSKDIIIDRRFVVGDVVGNIVFDVFDKVISVFIVIF